MHIQKLRLSVGSQSILRNARLQATDTFYILVILDFVVVRWLPIYY